MSGLSDLERVVVLALFATGAGALMCACVVAAELLDAWDHARRRRRRHKTRGEVTTWQRPRTAPPPPRPMRPTPPNPRPRPRTHRPNGTVWVTTEATAADHPAAEQE